MANFLRFSMCALFLCLMRNGSARSFEECEEWYMLVGNTSIPCPEDSLEDSSTEPPSPTPPTVPTNCTCVPYHQCEDNAGNLDIIDLVQSSDPIDACPHYLDVCCQNVSTVAVQNITNFIPNWTCGQHNPEGVGSRIRGNQQEACYGEFPWMVAVVQSTKKDYQSLVGGGSIIHPQVVLTASHSVKKMQDLLVLAGEWDAKTDKERYPVQIRKVREVIMHEDYDQARLTNDVALLVLDSPLESSPVVGTICLPEQGENMDNRNCLSSGWGKTAFGEKDRDQAILKKVSLDTIPARTCQDQLRKTRLGPRFTLRPSFICTAGKEENVMCQRDGGAPLVCPSKQNPNIYVQAGVVSWGIGCSDGIPTTYANVPLFRNWIDEKLNSLVNAKKISV